MPPHLPVAKHRVLDKVGIYIYMFNQPEKTPKQIRVSKYSYINGWYINGWYPPKNVLTASWRKFRKKVIQGRFDIKFYFPETNEFV